MMCVFSGKIHGCRSKLRMKHVVLKPNMATCEIGCDLVATSSASSANPSDMVDWPMPYKRTI